MRRKKFDLWLEKTIQKSFRLENDLLNELQELFQALSPVFRIRILIDSDSSRSVVLFQSPFPVFRIRFRIGSGFKQDSGYGSRRSKMTHKISAGCSLLRAEGFPCSLDFLYGGLGISELQFLIKKILHFFQM
jgi:hypothetical protein